MRRIYPWFLFLACATAITPRGSASGVGTAPNIVVILADDMGYSDLGCMGSEIATPNLDRLAANGLLFTNLYNTSRCCPTRASLLTGLYSHAAGVGDMDKDLGHPSYRGALGSDVVTVARVLGDAGYWTILSGKWHLGGAQENWPDRRGFQHFYGVPKGGGLYFYPSQFIDRQIFRDGEQVEPTDPDYYTTDAFTTEALRFVEQAVEDEKPFFLYLAYVAPHYPLQAHERDVAKYLGKYREGYAAVRQARFERQKALGIIGPEARLSPIYSEKSGDDPTTMDRKMAVYAAQVDCLDQNVGRFIERLDTLGVLENTLILFLSDNGAASARVNWAKKDGTRGKIGTTDSFVSYGPNWANVSNTPFRKFKAQEHEGGIASPLIVHWPGHLGKPRLVREVVHVIDIVPTLLDIVGVEHPSAHPGSGLKAPQGVSFARVLRGEPLHAHRRLFWEHEGNAGVREGSLKAVRLRGKPWELYDLLNDPTELENLATSRSEDLRRLVDHYRIWANENGVLPWPIVAASKNR